MITLTAERIIQLLESSEEPWKAQAQLAKKAEIGEIIAALQQAASAHPNVRIMLCYTLGRRCRAEAVPTLINCLNDPDPGVRTEAAEALGNIGDAVAGPALFERFAGVEDEGHKNLFAFALGAVGYRPAIPLLIQALRDPILSVSAAASLGELGAREAEEALKEALDEMDEADTSSRKVVTRALEAVRMVAAAENATDPGVKLDILARGLSTSDSLLIEAAAWTLSQFRGTEVPAARKALYEALSREKDTCATTRRIKAALDALESAEDGQ